MQLQPGSSRAGAQPGRGFLSKNAAPWLTWARAGRSSGARHGSQQGPHTARASAAVSDPLSGLPADAASPAARRQASPARAVSSLESPLQAAADPQEPQQPQRQLAVVAPATHSVVALAAAWDQLAPRLPLEMGMGQGAELILNALKLALASSSSGGAHPHDTLPPAARALGAGLRLADLASGGLPLDAEAIAAGVLADVLAHHHHLGGGNSGGAAGDATAGGPGLGAGCGLTHSLLLIEHRVGAGVAHLVHDVLRVRALPSRVDLYDDEAAAALRELCLSFYDPRATAVEVACRLEGLGALAACAAAPRYECQVAALEALQIYAPMGHALGMGQLTAQLEDCCFQLLFPESYARTAAWLQRESVAGQEALLRCQAAIHAAVLAQPRFHQLAGGLQVYGRTKSLFSTLKKLLRLGEMARGGRRRAEIYDLMGVRLVVQPRSDLPPEEAEAAAAQACYLVRDAVHSLWGTVPGRCKDYIAAPKENGYQSLHTTVQVQGETVTLSLDAEDGMALESAEAGGFTPLEVQIRTQAMHELAELGVAAHAAYKGGLAPAQVRQLRAWTDARHTLTAEAAAVALAAAPEGQPCAAEVLFRHLDRNGDGRLSLCELREALHELGAAGASSAGASSSDAGEAGSAGPVGAAAEELMALVDADADGSIDLGEFLEFHRKAGLLRALSEVDHETAEELERRVHPPAAAAAGGGSSGGGGGPGWAAAGAAGAALQRLGAVPPAMGLPLRAASPWAAARRGLMRWAAHNAASSSALHVNGGAGPGPGGRAVHAAAVPGPEVLSSSSSLDSSDLFELEEEQPGVISISTKQQQQQPAAGSSGEAPNGAAQRPPSSAAPAAAEQPTSSSSSSGGSAAAERAGPGGSAPAGASSAAGGRTASPAPRVARALSNAIRPLMRVWQQNRVLPAAAEWRLTAAPGNSHPLTGPVGEQLPAVVLPHYGPCVVGAVRNRDCDVVLDVPTVSGRHARLWVQRRAAANTSRLYVTDLGSTNGTWVNRFRIKPFQDVALYPGDLVHFAEHDVGFIVRVGPPAPAAAAAEAAAAGPLPAAVRAALEVAGALEAAAAAGGVFPAPAGGAARSTESVAQRARDLMAAQDFVAARMLLLGEAMRRPMAGGLWAQLANLERNLAKQASARPATCAAAGPPSWGTARAFYGAAVAAYAAQLPPLGAAAEQQQQGQQQGQGQQHQQQGQQQDEAAAVESVRGVVRALSGWAQIEYSQGNERAGRGLFRLAIRHAEECACGPAAAGLDLPRLLFTFAHKEWKQGDAAVAATLLKRVLALAPANHYALALLANIRAEAKQVNAARQLFQRALAAEPRYVTALQSWARLEAEAGELRRARRLFERALTLEPANTYVLTAWAVAEREAGHAPEARALFERCLAADPGCRKALHAWAKLEDEQGEAEAARQLYLRVLQMSPSSVETLSALGRLERLAGRHAEADRYLTSALRRDKRSASALRELSLLRAAEGATDEAARLEQDAQRVNEVRAQQLANVGKRRGGSSGGGGGGTQVKSTGSPARPQQPQHQHQQQQQPGEAQR